MSIMTLGQRINRVVSIVRILKTLVRQFENTLEGNVCCVRILANI